jgi:FeS assembly SUF system protein
MADIISLEDKNAPQKTSAPLDIVTGQEPISYMSMPAHGEEILAADNIPEQLLRQRIVQALSSIYDPEIPVNIYELGLIYALNIDDENNVILDMTLTSPACPVAGTLPGEVEQKIREVEGVNNVYVNLVWYPPYAMEMMSEAAQLQLGFM